MIFGTRRMLLVIDDAWQAEEALAFQIGAPHCAFLLTTRLPQVAFAFARENVIQITELAEEDSRTLPTRYIPQMVTQDEENARALVHAVGGLPLALILIGKYLASQALSGQPRRLQAALSQLHDTRKRLLLSRPTSPKERSPGPSDTTSLSLYAAIGERDHHLSPQAHDGCPPWRSFPPNPTRSQKRPP